MLATSLIEEFLCVPKYHLAVRDFCTRDICLYTANTELFLLKLSVTFFYFLKEEFSLATKIIVGRCVKINLCVG